MVRKCNRSSRRGIQSYQSKFKRAQTYGLRLQWCHETIVGRLFCQSSYFAFLFVTFHCIIINFVFSLECSMNKNKPRKKSKRGVNFLWNSSWRKVSSAKTQPSLQLLQVHLQLKLLLFNENNVNSLKAWITLHFIGLFSYPTEGRWMDGWPTSSRIPFLRFIGDW